MAQDDFHFDGEHFEGGEFSEGERKKLRHSLHEHEQYYPLLMVVLRALKDLPSKLKLLATAAALGSALTLSLKQNILDKIQGALGW